MGLDDLELLRGQPAGLVQDLFVDGDLADVVQGRGQRDVLLHLGGDVVDVGAFEQFFEHPLGEAVDVLNVQPALAVAELHQLAQHPHQHGGVPLPRADLFGQQADQPPLLGIELDGVEHPAVDDAGVERAGHVIRNTHLIGAADGGLAVLAGDHDNRQILDGVVAVHEVQHLKPVHLGHHKVQQHQRDIAHVLLHLFQAFLAVRSFEDAVIPAQDLRQDGAVHLGIVHDEDLRLFLPAARRILLKHLAGDDDAVFPDLGLIHQPVGLPDHGVHAVAWHLDQPADAGRKPHVAVAGHDGVMDLFADPLQFDFEVILRDAGQDEQKLVAAEAHQRIGLADAAAHDGGGGLQGHIARVVAVGIVVDLEVVQVHQRHADGAFHAADDFLVIAAVVHVGQRVVVQFGVVAGERAEQCLGVIGFDNGIAVHPLQQFQHIGGSVHLHIFGRHLHDVRREIFQLGALVMVFERTLHRAVVAAAAPVAAGIAQVFRVGVGAHALFDPLDGGCIQQTHIRIELLQIADERLNFLHCFHLRRFLRLSARLSECWNRKGAFLFYYRRYSAQMEGIFQNFSAKQNSAPPFCQNLNFFGINGSPVKQKVL